MSAVYSNPHGAVVIRQEGPDDDDDRFVFFTIEKVPDLIHALAEEAGLTVQVGRKTLAPAQPPTPTRRAREPRGGASLFDGG